MGVSELVRQTGGERTGVREDGGKARPGDGSTCVVDAAGGVRDARDLAQLERIGVAGALVATALHDGALKGADLDRFALKHKKREP